jgi:tetratricopeptide (TPR) repeat protein
MKKAREIGPLMPLWSAWLAWLYWGENDLDKALAEVQQAIEIAPDFPWSLYVLGGVYAANGMFDEALATHERLRTIMPNLANWGFATTYAAMGRRDDALEVAAEIAEHPGQKDLMYLGMIHAVLGNKDEALHWLEAAHDAHIDWFPWVGSGAGSEFTRALSTLADEPRFQALVASLNLPVQSPDYD